MVNQSIISLIMPKISIITPSKNTGRFAQETIESILAQSYENWEHIVVDGESTDGTLDVVKQYPHIRLISEKDSGSGEAFEKGLKMAKGEYVMYCAYSDGYLDKNWFKKCVGILENNLEIGLVWGLPQNMSEEGALERISYDYFFDNPPPQGKDFIYYWLKTNLFFPEGNFCVRKNILDACHSLFISRRIDREILLSFNYDFNTLGYQPYFIPVVASYGRVHYDSTHCRQMANGELPVWIKRYFNDIKRYKKGLIDGRIIHKYRDGFGNLLSDRFDRKKIS